MGAKALYWTARSHHAQGDRPGALGALEALRRRAPFGYYGVLGAALHLEIDPGRPEWQRRPPGMPLPVALPDLAPWLAALDGLPAAVALGEARALLRAGYPRRARLHVAAMTEDPQVKARLGDRLAGFSHALDHATERFGARWQADARRRLPWDEGFAEHPLDVLAVAYPLAWQPLAEAAGRLHGVSPWWLLAHMLQESRFKERAHSHAGALGPMQVLPRTGRRIASRIGVPPGEFFAARLFEPGVALRHAAWYLGALRADLGGSLPLAVGAYNGGPMRFADHVDAHASSGLPELIEEIGAHESRNYLRKVADHLVRYATLYADDAEHARLLAALRPPPVTPRPRREVGF